MSIAEPVIIFDESILPLLEEHKTNGIIQFSINQLLVSECQDTYILNTEHCEICIIKHKNIMYVTK